MKSKTNEQRVREIIRKMILEVMTDIVSESTTNVGIDFPPYRLELSPDSQVIFKKNGKLFKAIDVKPDFGKKDLIKLAQTYAKKFNSIITTDLKRL